MSNLLARPAGARQGSHMACAAGRDVRDCCLGVVLVQPQARTGPEPVFRSCREAADRPGGERPCL